MDNKKIFSNNLNYYMDINDKTRKDVADAIGVSYFTFTDWAKGKTYPRMDKVEKLADYFGILKSDLIEDKTKERVETQKKADTISDAVLKMKTNPEFLSLIEKLVALDSSQIRSVDGMISAFLK